MMAELLVPIQADSAGKPAVVEINENTLNNISIPDIKNLLVDRMNPDFGLLDKLLASNALSRADLEEVKNQGTSYKKNSLLLELVTKNEKLKELFNGLKDTRQEHLVNYVTAKGEYIQDYGGVWPLTERETSILNGNQEALTDFLDFSTNEIVNKLFESNFLNRRQKEFICKRSCDYEKAEALLGLLYRSSMSDYWKMISCLGDTKHQLAAEILLGRGAVVRVHNTVTGEIDAATAAENEIVTRIQNILSSVNLKESNRLLERLQLTLFAARVGHSVNLYILCETIDNLMHLSDLLNSGELHREIERLFNKLISRSERVDVFTSVSEETLDKCKKFLEVDYSQEKVSGKDILKVCEQNKVEKERRTEEEEEEESMEVEQRQGEEAVDARESHSGVEEVPEEIRGAELSEEDAQAAAAKAAATEAAETAAETAAAEAAADAAVEDEKRGLTPFVRTALEMMAALIRNNTDYFLEYMRPRGLIDRLHGEGSLTDEETRYIKTLKEDMDKNDEILKVIRGHGVAKYYVLIGFLRNMNQNLVAEVAEKGGVVLKATISNEEDDERVEKLLVDRINQLLNKTSSRSMKLVQFLSLLNRGDIQILNAKWEYGIIVWFWCQSGRAMQVIDEMNESSEEKLTKLITELFKVLLDGTESIPEIANIDLEDPDKTFAIRTSSLIRDKELPVPECSVCAVTILNSNIYILRQKPSSLLVFDEKDLSNQSSEIPLAVITDPVDMVASQKSLCLYITDRANSSIWKFTPTDGNITSWLKNIGGPYTLSATSDGGVIRVDLGPPSHLDVYGADAQRVSHIQLQAFVKVPHHAVETPAGTYVISYGESSGGKNGVCEIARNGNVISIFDTLLEAVEGIDPTVNKYLKETFAGRKLACYPRYLAVNEHGEIYATDPDNNRLAVFDSRLKLEAVIQEKLFVKPVNLHCLKNDRRLLIVYIKEEQPTVGLFSHVLT